MYPLLPEFYFVVFLGHSLRYALFVYRLIVATPIANFFDDHFYFKIKSLAIRDKFVTRGHKGLMKKCLNNEMRR